MPAVTAFILMDGALFAPGGCTLCVESDKMKPIERRCLGALHSVSLL